MNCEFCQSPVHIWFQCPKKPDGWKPARLAKKSAAEKKGSPRIDRPVLETSGKLYGSGESPAGEMSRSADANRQRVAESVAGTQALPVDTNTEAGYANVEHRVAPKVLSVSSPAPATKFDKKAWMREYMRGYMRKRRAKNKGNA